MSIAYEPRDFMHGGNYPPLDDHDHTSDADRFVDPGSVDLSAVAAGTYAPEPSTFAEEARLQLSPLAPPPKDDTPPPALASTPQRIKPIPKPDREVTKTLMGKYYCNHPGCAEEQKEFNRKCEWSKHMDKHDRPYKCTAEGCEKLPGFTYSGGLLRHEREVHGKHGGPKNPLHCPHPNCKRHSGKGFSRQENLNEHLRRVHTGSGVPSAGEETDDAISEIAPVTVAVTSLKRPAPDDEPDQREEIKRLRRENEELRRQVENQTRQTVVMMNQIAQLQEALGPRLAPTAQML
ncbi:Cell wall transcription factor ACE2 [Pleurostoma richardsiae]|uniref:Cell wall transcription factor ACE2 n=1 Tax=Pleurostoma richardsiae TaxID=41990 RepID=A0AA38RS73_9PEZI|nr:Cell wall transcription factor ACE2 [Pleurostoma richardsiae]